MKLSKLCPIILTIAENIFLTEMPLLEDKKFHSYIEKEGDQLVFTFGDVTLWMPGRTDAFFIIKAIRVYVKSTADNQFKIAGLMVNTRGTRLYNQKSKQEQILSPDDTQSEQLKQLVLQKLKERELTANRPSRGNVYDLVTNELEKEDVRSMFTEPVDVTQQGDDISDPFAWSKPEVKARDIPAPSSEPIPEPVDDDYTLPGEDSQIDDANEYYDIPGNDYYDRQDIPQSTGPDINIPAVDDYTPPGDEAGVLDSGDLDSGDLGKQADIEPDQQFIEPEMPSMADVDDLSGEEKFNHQLDNDNGIDDVLLPGGDEGISQTEPEQVLDTGFDSVEVPERPISLSDKIDASLSDKGVDDLSQGSGEGISQAEPEQAPDTAFDSVPEQPTSLSDKIDASLSDKGLDDLSQDISPKPEIAEPKQEIKPTAKHTRADIPQPEVRPGTTRVASPDRPVTPKTKTPREIQQPAISAAFNWDNLDAGRGTTKNNKNQLNAIIGRALETNPLNDASKAALGLLSRQVVETKQEKVFELKGNIKLYQTDKMKKNIESINEWAKSALGVSGSFINLEPNRIRIKLP